METVFGYYKDWNKAISLKEFKGAFIGMCNKPMHIDDKDPDSDLFNSTLARYGALLPVEIGLDMKELVEDECKEFEKDSLEYKAISSMIAMAYNSAYEALENPHLKQQASVLSLDEKKRILRCAALKRVENCCAALLADTNL